MHGQHFARFGQIGNANGMFVVQKLHAGRKQFGFIPHHHRFAREIVEQPRCFYKGRKPTIIHAFATGLGSKVGNDFRKTRLSVGGNTHFANQRRQFDKLRLGKCADVPQRVNVDVVGSGGSSVRADRFYRFHGIVPKINAKTLVARHGQIQNVAAQRELPFARDAVHATITAGNQFCRKFCGVVSSALLYAKTALQKCRAIGKRLQQTFNTGNGTRRTVQDVEQGAITLVHACFGIARFVQQNVLGGRHVHHFATS